MLKKTLLALIAVTAAQAGTCPPIAKAEMLGTQQIPITINVKKVKITDKDVQRAAKLCLIKEGTLKPEKTGSIEPTPAQTVVMATMCE